jgi:hypothetical protein
MEHDILTLYDLAKTEGEGLGTAYEYKVKLALIEKGLAGKEIRSVLIYGLPKKYGSSMDFFYLAKQKRWKTFVVLDKEEEKRLASLQGKDLPIRKSITITDSPPAVDLLLSCEVVQDLDDRRHFLSCLDNAKDAFIFAPNAHNANHRSFSGLNGLDTEEMRWLFPEFKIGFCDIPPFPPGSKNKGLVPERLILSILKHYARFEHLAPMKKELAHIIYAKSTY